MAEPVPTEIADRYLADAREVSAGGPAAVAAIAAAAAWRPEATTASRESVERAIGLARHAGAVLLESAALDALTTFQLREPDDAARTVAKRRELLHGRSTDPSAGFELYDTYHMSCQIDLARGDFASARRHADAITALPFFRETRHLGLGRRMEVDAMAGEFHDAVRHGELFERDWASAGRLPAGNLACGAYAVSMAHALLGDDDEHLRWREIATALLLPGRRSQMHGLAWAPTFDAIVELHRGDADSALGRLVAGPDAEDFWRNPNSTLWRKWYAAVWAEAAVLACTRDAGDRLAVAAGAALGNPVAVLLVERARCLHVGDLEALASIERDLAGLGARYQAARTARLRGAADVPSGEPELGTLT
jgi:hypothetical protein